MATSTATGCWSILPTAPEVPCAVPTASGRYGGEEFLILLPNTAADVALPVAERIRAALSAGHALDCQASIGLTHWRGPEDTLDAMLGRADAALYQNQGAGRNQTCST